MASQWPPRSPHEALLSTPGGRERLRRMQDRTSPSPSPSKSRSANRLQPAIDFDDDDDDDDDEEDVEMLELKLQAIKAKLKLKKLQAAKAKEKAPASSDAGIYSSRRPESAASGVGVPLQSRLAAAREKLDRDQDAARAASAGGGVQIPASPVRKVQARPDATSPQRVILGIDKGLRAADVSLRRAPSFRKTTEENGGYTRRARTPNLSAAQKADQGERPKSFNERLAVARSEEAERAERLVRIQKLRTQNFGLGQQEMEQYKSAAVELPDLPSKPEEFSREQILRTVGKAVPTDDRSRSTSQPADPGSNPEASAAFDSYSGFHLSKRILPHQVLTRTLAQKKTYLIKDLLVQVKAPDWSLPDEECDIVVFAIIAGKSDPRHHAPRPGVNGKPPTERGKYMVLTLVDLEYEIELFLFDDGFSRWWKLQPGTVVAILNPGIMPPAPGKAATGRFSLVINSDADMILELGNARDLGFCKSVKKDGAVCSAWINRKRTEYCEFHTNEAVKKMGSKRMEFNSDPFGGGAAGPKSKWLKSRKNAKEEEDERKWSGYDRSTGTQFFVSTAALMDGHTGIVDRAEREEALKRRLAHKERERDIAKKLGQIGGGAGKEYMSRAADYSDTVGATAFGAAIPGMSSATTGTLPGEKPPRPDARKLGLVLPRGEQPKVDLGRAKRKRPDSALSGTSSTATTLTATAQNEGLQGRAAFGWGTALSTKLSRMKEGEKLDGTNGHHGGDIGKAFAKVAEERQREKERETSPVRKKTRFVTEKGIREAGRESLGEPLSAAAKIRRQVVLDDSDDDDLVIVK